MEISLYSAEECEKIAQSAALRYIQDSFPGIWRKRCGKGFAYYYPDGKKIVDKKELKRIKSLAIPPAYQKVWICPFANGHIQATSRDDKNRKQYHYHSLWQEARQKLKFDTMIEFGQAIFLVRKHINDVISQSTFLSKKQVICTILYLLDTSCIRIGNAVYAKENKTYGLTTLRKKHLLIKQNQVVLNFEGKNAKTWQVKLYNKKIIRILKKCEEIPGYELFKYRDENNQINVITSQDINHYLKSLTKYPFTAKDFRTWIASREVFCRLLELSTLKKNSKDFKLVLKEVAILLGHTPSICQKSYVYPKIMQWWKTGKLEEWKSKNRRKINSLNSDQLFIWWLKNIEKTV